MKSIYVFVWIATLAAVPAQAGTCPGILAHPAVQQLTGEIMDTFKACFPQMVELMKVTANQKKQEETQQAEMVTESATGTNDIAVTVEKVGPEGIIHNGKCVVLQGDPAEETRKGRIKGVPDDQWCNAIRVTTKDVNRTSAFLRYFVTCTVYGSNLTVLGKGASSISAPDMYTNQTPDFGELSSFGTSASIIRIPNVKLDSVARVECRASRR